MRQRAGKSWCDGNINYVGARRSDVQFFDVWHFCQVMWQMRGRDMLVPALAQHELIEMLELMDLSATWNRSLIITMLTGTEEHEHCGLHRTRLISRATHLNRSIFK